MCVILIELFSYIYIYKYIYIYLFVVLVLMNFVLFCFVCVCVCVCFCLLPSSTPHDPASAVCSSGRCAFVSGPGRSTGAPDAPSFKIDDVRSEAFIPAGKPGIASAAWTLPVAVASATTLGNAVGAGGLALVLTESSRTLSWKGQPSALPSGPLTHVDPGMITVLALEVRGLGAKENIPLWESQPGSPPSLPIRT